VDDKTEKEKVKKSSLFFLIFQISSAKLVHSAIPSKDEVLDEF